MTPDEYVSASFIILAALIGWAVGYWTCHRQNRARLDEPEPVTHGDDGGRPTPMTHMEVEDTPAPEIGSGLRAGGVPRNVCRRAAAKVTRDRVRDMPAPETGSGLRTGDR